MSITQVSVKSPVGVLVGVIFIVLFGTLCFYNISVQLTPDVDKPSVTVETRWPGASPYEIEREVVQKQEDELKNVDSLLKISSESQDSLGTVILEFPVGTDIDSSMLKVSNKLSQVKDYPDLVENPVISNVDRRSGAIAWFVLQPLNAQSVININDYRDLCEDVIKPRFERVSGVASSNIFGGAEKDLRIIFDPNALSARNLTVNDIISAVNLENTNISAGDFDEGKRRYVVRTLGEFTSPEQIENIPLKTDSDGSRIYLRDVAIIKLGHKDLDFSVRHFGRSSIAINCQRAAGANVLDVMDSLQQTMTELNESVLNPMGLRLRQVYDETIYIHSAIDLVKQNILVGGLLAIGILFLFLRSFTSVFIIATAIPISIVGSFLVMYLLGRNVNVISLAGMSFAVGMVVDNAIVVLENIFRHRQEGKSRYDAALKGTLEVWGAVLASTLTTLAVFLPILFMQEEVGQLFKDIALAINSSVALSLLISISVIPMLASRILSSRRKQNIAKKPDSWLDHKAKEFTIGLSHLILNICKNPLKSLIVALGLTLTSFLVSMAIIPPAEYLPTGNRNLIFAILIPPPGYNLDKLTRLGEGIESKLKPHFAQYMGIDLDQPQSPVIQNFFFVARGRQVFMGAVAKEADEVKQLIPVMQEAVKGIPGLIAIVTQASLFGRSIGQGRSIDVEVSGPDLPHIIGLGGRIFGQAMQLLSGSQIQPIPGLDLGNPEIQIIPDRELLADFGISTTELGVMMDILLDGRKISEYQYKGKSIDIMLEGEESVSRNAEKIAQIPFSINEDHLIKVGQIAEVLMASGPAQINHIERQRTITIRIVPPEQIPLEVAMDIINEQIITPIRNEGHLGGDNFIHLSGTADDLSVTKKSLGGKFILALVITYLLMAALFENFLYPFVIMFTVPLAGVGGLLGLKAVNLLSPQSMDVLTMLGFVILIGTVVNNAILIVHQTLNVMKDEGLDLEKALFESIRTRIRPIFMSTMTSVFGMLPLVLFPGAGSELYRGLGSVVVGGLSVSTVFTLFLIPVLFYWLYHFRQIVIKKIKDGYGES